MNPTRYKPLSHITLFIDRILADFRNLFSGFELLESVPIMLRLFGFALSHIIE
jgi:hypothetical protein